MMWKTLWNCGKLTIIYVLTLSTLSTIMVLTLNKRKESKMDDETRKQLEEAHKKAMEGIKALNETTKDTIEYVKKSIGL